MGIDDSDMKFAEELKGKYDDVLARQHALVQQLVSRLGGNERAKADQIEGVLQRSHAIDEKIGTYNHKIDGLLDEKIGPIRATIAEEKTRIVGYGQTLGGYTGESAELGGGVLAEGLRNVLAALLQRRRSRRCRHHRRGVGAQGIRRRKTAAASPRSASVSLKLLDDEFKEVLKERP